MAESNREEIVKLEAIYANNPGGRVFTHLAEAYRKAGELSRARSILDTGIGRHPDYASAYVVLGRVMMDQGALQEAAGSFQRVLELDPENRVALRTMGDLARTDDPARALVHYRQLQSLDPSDEELAELIEQLAAQTTPETASGTAASQSEAPEAAASQAPEPAPTTPAGAAQTTPAEPPEQEVGSDFTLDWSAAENPLEEEFPGDIEQLAQAAPEPWNHGNIDVAPVPDVEPAATPEAPTAAGAEGPGAVDDGAEQTPPADLAAAAPAADEPWLAVSGPADAAEPMNAEAPAQPEPQIVAEPEATFEGLLTTDLSAPSPLAESPEAQPADLETETLAELYRTQGVYQRSIEIYRSLLEQRPGDERLRQRLEEVEQLERAATIEPISGLSLDLDAGLIEEEALAAAPEFTADAAPGDVWNESVDSAWTDGGGSADVAHPPYAWELEQQEEDRGGLTLQQYLAQVLNWRPAVLPEVEAKEEVAPAWDERVEETQPDLATWVAPEADLVLEHEVPAWEQEPDAQPWETSAEAAAGLEDAADEPGLHPESLTGESEPWLPPLAEAGSEDEPWLSPPDAGFTAEADARLEASTDSPIEFESVMPEGLSEIQPGDQNGNNGGVQDAFEEWFTETPEPSAPAATTGSAAVEEKVEPAGPEADAEEDGEEESDDDLEMFRSWLQSLKR